MDVERGRTVKSWRPRRLGEWDRGSHDGYSVSCDILLGGGLGGTRRGSAAENIKYSGRVDER